MNWFSLLLPISYLTILVSSLATFSYFYRRHQALSKQRLEPWFPTHLQRDIYLSLLELQARPDTKVPDSVLKAALLRRAVEDIHRLISLRSQKPALVQLVQRGSVGDELNQRFQLAEKEMELELKDVVQEANALAPQQNWGQTIFQSASEMAHREVLGRKLSAIEETRAEVKEEWQGRRKRVAEGFAKELEGGSAAPVAQKAGIVEEKPRSKDGSSDEDIVKVEADVPDDNESVTSEQATLSGASTPSGGGKKKKKSKNSPRWRISILCASRKNRKGFRVARERADAPLVFFLSHHRPSTLTDLLQLLSRPEMSAFYAEEDIEETQVFGTICRRRFEKWRVDWQGEMWGRIWFFGLVKHNATSFNKATDADSTGLGENTSYDKLLSQAKR